MGCDIHLHTEIKVGGRWLHYGAPEIGRHYGLFTRMANVRSHHSDIKPISYPRGLPDDISETTQWEADRWGVDGRSHSYLRSDELPGLRQWAKDYGLKGKHGSGCWFDDTFGFLCGNTFDGFVTHPENSPPDLEDVRFVFWFDN